MNFASKFERISGSSVHQSSYIIWLGLMVKDVLLFDCEGVAFLTGIANAAAGSDDTY